MTGDYSAERFRGLRGNVPSLHGGHSATPLSDPLVRSQGTVPLGWLDIGMGGHWALLVGGEHEGGGLGLSWWEEGTRSNQAEETWKKDRKRPLFQ